MSEKRYIIRTPEVGEYYRTTHSSLGPLYLRLLDSPDGDPRVVDMRTSQVILCGLHPSTSRYICSSDGTPLERKIPPRPKLDCRMIKETEDGRFEVQYADMPHWTSIACLRNDLVDYLQAREEWEAAYGEEP